MEHTREKTHNFLGCNPADALVTVLFVTVLDWGHKTVFLHCLISSCQVTSCSMIISIVFYRCKSSASRGQNGLLSTCYWNCLSQHFYQMYDMQIYVYTMCWSKLHQNNFTKLRTHSILHRMKWENNIIFIFMKPCVGSVN